MRRYLAVLTVLPVAKTVSILRLLYVRSALKRMFPLGYCRLKMAILDDPNANKY